MEVNVYTITHGVKYNLRVDGKNKGGRPRLANGARLTLLIRYSKDQRASWKRKAKAAGLKVGTWLKKLADEAPD